MDSFGPKPGPFGKTVEGSATVARTPAQLACNLGRRVLLQGFKVVLFNVQGITIICTIKNEIKTITRTHFQMHEPIRGEILEQVLNRLVTKTASPVSHYLGKPQLKSESHCFHGIFFLTVFSSVLADLFSDIVISAPMMLLESSARLTETFDHLSYLPLTTVQGLLKAIQVPENTHIHRHRQTGAGFVPVVHDFFPIHSSASA